MNTKEIKYSHLIEGKIFFMKRLDELGIKRKYTGYYSLIEIMETLINQGKNIISFSKEIYPLIADKYGKTVCTIERNIRSLIKTCWSFERFFMLKINIQLAGNLFFWLKNT